MTTEQQGFEALVRAQNLVELGRSIVGRQDVTLYGVRLLASISATPHENKAWHIHHACPPDAVPATCNTAIATLLASELIETHDSPHAWGKCVYYKITTKGASCLAQMMAKMPAVLRSKDYLALSGKSKQKKGENHECSRACSR